MNNFYKTGTFICELRKAKGISQEELGSILHVTKKAVSRWETGRGLPDSSLLLPLAEILEVRVEELLRGEFICEGDLDEENKKRMEKMNAVFEYLAEKKLLQKTLVAYAPITLATVLCGIRAHHLLNEHKASLDFMFAYPFGAENTFKIQSVFFILLLVFFVSSVILVYRLTKTLITRKNIRFIWKGKLL